MYSSDNGRMLVFSGRANPLLAENICKYLDIPLGKTVIRDFSDKEIYVRIEENVRGADVFVIQPTCFPGNTNVMELLIMIDALRRSSAKRITSVIPYYGYGRQDRKCEPRVPITSKLIDDLLAGDKCDLPKLSESIEIHRIYLRSLLEHWKNVYGSSVDSLPIT